MSDKYDKWAESYVRENGWFNDDWMVTGCRYVADAMRLCAAKLEKERRKDKCEWVGEYDDGVLLSFKTGCGQWMHFADGADIYHDTFCPHCGRRIVEKGEK